MMKEQVLNLLRQQNGYRSGEEISLLLGVSRTAVWKTIRQLRQEGYTIEASTHRGYRLTREADLLSQQTILEALQAHELDRWISQVVYRQTVDSTNLMARRAAESGVADRSLFIADQQSNGRGRRGRTWFSDSGLGLTFSLLLRPAAEAQALTPVTLFAGLCSALALNELLTNRQAIGIKWPNDLLSASSGKKVGGILTEVIIEENRVDALIIGIGINLNNSCFPADLQDTATSVLVESKIALRRVDVLCHVISQFAKRSHEMANPQQWLAQYRANCQTLGQPVRILTAGGQEQSGTAIDIDANGELIIADENGQTHTVRSGEVSLRRL